MKRFIIALTIVSTALTSCEEEILTKFTGKYSGIFICSDSKSSTRPSGRASITFNGNTYTYTGNENRIPAGGSGSFEILDSQSVRFQDHNLWTADFDWGLILNGEYTYKAQGDSLFLAKYIGGLKVFEYRLEKIH